MVDILDPQEGESIYDPTCGTAGMLISTLDQVKRSGGEHRTLRLYGQERNHMTASIARMNLALHGVEDFAIVRGDTLERPAFTDRDSLRKFDVVLANPPYSIKQWNRDAWQSDPGGRNFLGTPPHGWDGGAVGKTASPAWRRSGVDNETRSAPCRGRWTR